MAKRRIKTKAELKAIAIKIKLHPNRKYFTANIIGGPTYDSSEERAQQHHHGQEGRAAKFHRAQEARGKSFNRARKQQSGS
jgi:hypothetical protein